MDTAHFLVTPRLVLPPLSIADAPAIGARFPRWEIVRFLADSVPWPYPPDGARRFIAEMALPAMRRGEAWQWTIRRRAEPDTVIGVVGLMLTEDDNRGFWLDPDFQGRGLMGEACRAANAFWFDVLGRDVLRAPKAAANERSRRLSMREGGRVVRTVERGYVSGRLPAELWELTRADRAARAEDAGAMFVVEEGDLARDDVRALLALHLAAARANSPPGHSFALDLDGLRRPEVTVSTIRRHGAIAAVGALRTLGADAGELKSMRTHPDHLRTGAATSLLLHLVATARERGLARLSLETGSGVHFEPALALYRRHGFREGEAFAGYAPSAFSRFFHLAL